MTGVEDNPDEGSLVADFVGPDFDFVIDDCSFDGLFFGIPDGGVGRQENLVQAIGLDVILIIVCRLLAAVARHQDEDDVVFLSFCGEVFEGFGDVVTGGTRFRLLWPTGQSGDVFFRELKAVAGEDLLGESDIVDGSHKPLAAIEGRVFGNADKESVVCSKGGFCGQQEERACYKASQRWSFHWREL